MTQQKILIVDDDVNICEIIRLYLSHEGYELCFAHNGSEALNRFRLDRPELVILDLMLPIINGMEVCKLIRIESNIPILMITAKDTVDDKVFGLETGADDYVPKPFDPKEVVARVKALLRRSGSPQNGRIATERMRLQDIEIDMGEYRVCQNGVKVDLTPKEIQLLHFLVSHQNRVFSREQLLEKVWGYDYAGETRTVDVHVKRLREKLETSDTSWKIQTVWGIGYKLEVD